MDGLLEIHNPEESKAEACTQMKNTRLYPAMPPGFHPENITNLSDRGKNCLNLNP